MILLTWVSDTGVLISQWKVNAQPPLLQVEYIRDQRSTHLRNHLNSNACLLCFLLTVFLTLPRERNLYLPVYKKKKNQKIQENYRKKMLFFIPLPHLQIATAHIFYIFFQVFFLSLDVPPTYTADYTLFFSLSGVLLTFFHFIL